MSRKVRDSNLSVWEVFASTGAFGFPDRPHIVFRSLTDPAARPRYIEWEGDKSGAERAVHTLPSAELLAMLGRTESLR